MWTNKSVSSQEILYLPNFCYSKTAGQKYEHGKAMDPPSGPQKIYCSSNVPTQGTSVSIPLWLPQHIWEAEILTIAIWKVRHLEAQRGQMIYAKSHSKVIIPLLDPEYPGFSNPSLWAHFLSLNHVSLFPKFHPFFLPFLDMRPPRSISEAQESSSWQFQTSPLYRCLEPVLQPQNPPLHLETEGRREFHPHCLFHLPNAQWSKHCLLKLDKEA